MTTTGRSNFQGTLEHSTLKTPPAWNPDWSQQYPFRHWYADVANWAAATDIDAVRQAPAVAMQLGGLARAIAREIDVVTLQNGRIEDIGDGMGTQPISGLAVLLLQLQKRFDPLSVEQGIAAIAELLQFNKMQGETVD